MATYAKTPFVPRVRPPGPKPHFLIGNFPLGSRDPLGTFTRWAGEFGDIFYYRAIYLPVFFLNRPDLIEQFLITQNENFGKDRVIQNSRWFLGEGLLTSEGPAWLRQRRLCQPAFHRERIASYAEPMTSFTEEMLAHWQDGETRDIHQDMMQLTLRIVAKVLFGVEVEAETRKVSAALNALMQYSSGARMVLPPWFRFLPLPALARVRKSVRQLDETVFSIIQHHHSQNGHGNDLLSILMSIRDEDGSRMSDQHLRDEIMTFMLAGHETTALALSWTWYLLSQNPEAEQKLHRELNTVLAGRIPGYEDLPRLPYTDKVLKESMRLYPPAWGVGRVAIRNCTLDGYEVPAGANVVASQWVMHRNPRYFPNPNVFNPDRWSLEMTRSLPKFAYFPFGGGPRLCIGAGFATMEAALLLATIAQKIQLKHAPGHKAVPVPSITLRPKYGMQMTLQNRH
jgi:cytochrome P450